jgi:hypothetical protein
MIFKQMNPDDVRKALEGHENVIEKEMRKVTEYFSNLSCLYCGGSCRAITNSKKIFEPGEILPNFLAECNDCGCQFTPYTKIEVKGPTKNPLEDSL